MADYQPLSVYYVNDVEVRVYPSLLSLAAAAAADGAATIRWAIETHGNARVVFTAAKSQIRMIEWLIEADVDWSRVTVFQMTEYLGLPADHPGSSRRWLEKHLLSRVAPGRVELLRGDAPNIGVECARYGDLLHEAPIDAVFAGFGENGRLAFNDPASSDFNDPATVKVVKLDDSCRGQQVFESLFVDSSAVPTHAYTLTLPALMRGRRIICCVPEARKAEAVRNALDGPLTRACPSSFLITHHNATIYLDTDSASMLTRPLSRVLD
ncbi:MAG: 6-phosphogluconolactonase [Candidatus Sumerlaeia bacterium]